MIYTIFVFLNNFLVGGGLYAQNTLEERLDTVLSNGDVEDGEKAVEDFIQDFVNFAVPFGVFCALALLAYAAFVMITSAGNPDKLNDAREIATNAVIGAVMIGVGVIVLRLIAQSLLLPGVNW